MAENLLHLLPDKCFVQENAKKHIRKTDIQKLFAEGTQLGTNSVILTRSVQDILNLSMLAVGKTTMLILFAKTVDAFLGITRVTSDLRQPRKCLVQTVLMFC